jgi:hypothetical protein
MVEITLFELNLDDASFSGNAPFSGAGSESGEDWETDESSEDDEGGRSVLPFVVGLVFLIGIGLAVKRLRGGSGGSESVEVETDVEHEAPTP